jgi:nucleoid-associated protein YejK
LKRKEEINPFKFSPDVDFCALSQIDKREKAQVKYSLLQYCKNYLFE